MVHEEPRNKSFAAKAAWPLLVLTAVFQVYMGLSLVAYAFMEVPDQASGLERWTAAAMGALQCVAAVVAFVLAVWRDLRGVILAVSGSLMLGWLSTLPSVVERGLDFQGNDKATAIYLAAAPVIAITAATLAWRNVYLIAAALIASAMTFVGILVVIVLGIAIAMYGF